MPVLVAIVCESVCVAESAARIDCSSILMSGRKRSMIWSVLGHKTMGRCRASVSLVVHLITHRLSGEGRRGMSSCPPICCPAAAAFAVLPALSVDRYG